MKNIAIFGAGGFGTEVAAMLRIINDISPEWNLVGFYDDTRPKGEAVSHFGKILGGMNELNSVTTPLCVAICVGSPSGRKKIIERIDNPLLEFPNLFSPDFVVEDPETFSAGMGNIVKSHCRVTCNVNLGDFNVLNGTVTVGHDSRVGNCNVFMPGVRVSGNTVIGDNNLFGAGSFIKQGLRIGHDVTLSPLSPLLTRPKDGCIYMGNPAKILKF
jgi:sugar O-acyltransferase (sialic acid O-acetyltransferase NeuD family)